MQTLRNLLVLGLFSFTKGEENFVSLTSAVLSKSRYACVSASKDTYFLPTMVTGKPWRIYYTWNMKMEDKCVDVHFQTATPAITRRIYYDMSRLMEEEPLWETASLLMTMGRDRQEMLLIPYEGSLGRFQAVNSGLGDTMVGKKVPLLNLQLKLLHRGKFLLFVDCQVGIAWLAMRVDEPRFRMEVGAVAGELASYLDEGFHACINEKNELENILQAEDKKHELPNTYFNE